MSHKNRLKELRNVVDLIFDREMSALSEISHKTDVLHDEVKVLDQALHELMAQRADAELQDAEFYSKHDINWQNWRRKSKAELNTKLAVLKAEREAQLALTRKAFGRSNAIGNLILKSGRR